MARQPKPGCVEINTVTRLITAGFHYAILLQWIIQDGFTCSAASSVISLGPLSMYTADAYFPKWGSRGSLSL
jgi:hypothetical protein